MTDAQKTLMELGRFWSKVDKKGPRWNGTHCWIWTGALADGYGSIKFRQKTCTAHRLSYENQFGPVPDGYELDHLCRRRPCVRPSHLETVTHRVNLLRGESPSAIHARKTRCPQDHPYDKQNTYYTKRGSRACRECNRIRGRKSQEAVARAVRNEDESS